MPTLRLLAACAVVLVPSLLCAGDNRTWTDNQGRQINAEFIRIFNGAVVLKQGNRIVQVPLRNLIQADQDFARAGGEPPEAESDEPPAIDRPAEPQQRRWTDRKGNQIEATFVRLHENQIVLSASGRVKMFPLEDFSDDDHAYVKDWLIGDGKQAEADAMEQYLANRRNQAARPGPAAGAYAPRGPAAGNYTPQPSNQFQEMQDRMAEQRRQMEQRMEESRRQREAQRAEERARFEQQQAERLARQQQLRQQQQSQLASQPRTEDYARRHVPAPTIPQAPRYQPIYDQRGAYICSSCKKEVSSNLQAGDNCPHCGIYFDVKEDEYGRREYASGSGSGGFSFSGRGLRGGIGLIVIVLGALGALIRKLTS